MTEFVKISNKSNLVKLRKIIEQFDDALSENFPFDDANKAIIELKNISERLIVKISGFEEYSSPIKRQLSLHIKYHLNTSSWILGIITRSSTMRNAFELYTPFKRMSKDFFKKDVHLIISSEWNYIPFTYPMNIEELPDFIIIGLPAPESNNVLIFPSAGHELGHSIWFKENYNELYSNKILQKTDDYLASNTNILDSILSNFKMGHKNETDDLFEKQVRAQFLDNAINSSIRQMEELFCDFIALFLFGKSYLYAFQYLVAPGDGGGRSTEYPSIDARAKILQKYATKLGINADNYAQEFSKESNPQSINFNTQLLRVADHIRSEFVDDIFELAKKRIDRSAHDLPNNSKIDYILKHFTVGMPTDIDASLGELITAAWQMFLKEESAYQNSGSRNTVNYISDLVLKSVEAQEINRLIHA